ncbi:MAG TPA: hypothetical protein VF177_08715 [Anaerolineae bacterium]
MTQLLVFKCDCDEAVEQVTGALTGAGFRVLRSFDLRQAWRQPINEAALGGLRAASSFDLRSAMTAPGDCSCPYHGTDPCDCQMVVMLVYASAGSPATLVAHGHNGQTWITLIDTPEQRPAPDVATALIQTLNETVPM